MSISFTAFGSLVKPQEIRSKLYLKKWEANLYKRDDNAACFARMNNAFLMHYGGAHEMCHGNLGHQYRTLPMRTR